MCLTGLPQQLWYQTPHCIGCTMSVTPISTHSPSSGLVCPSRSGKSRPIGELIHAQAYRHSFSVSAAYELTADAYSTGCPTLHQRRSRLCSLRNTDNTDGEKARLSHQEVLIFRSPLTGIGIISVGKSEGRAKPISDEDRFVLAIGANT